MAPAPWVSDASIPLRKPKLFTLSRNIDRIAQMIESMSAMRREQGPLIARSLPIVLRNEEAESGATGLAAWMNLMHSPCIREPARLDSSASVLSH